MVIEGERLQRSIVAQAAAAGAVLPEQVQAITRVLQDLPADFDTDQLRQEAEELMVGFADTHNAADLRALSRYLVEVLDPDTADAREAARLERDLRTAAHNRHLTFAHDHHGSVRIRGNLPVADAGAVHQADRQLYRPSIKKVLDVLDPLAPNLTPAQRRADILMALVDRHLANALAPSHGGDRPRVDDAR